MFDDGADVWIVVVVVDTNEGGGLRIGLETRVRRETEMEIVAGLVRQCKLKQRKRQEAMRV